MVKDELTRLCKPSSVFDVGFTDANESVSSTPWTAVPFVGNAVAVLDVSSISEIEEFAP